MFQSKKIITLLLSVVTFTVFQAQADTMRQVIIHTINTNPEVLLSGHVREASEASVGVAKAPYFPSVDINAGIGRERSKNVTTGFSGITLTRREAGITLDQMLFDGFGTYFDVKRTKYKTNADAYQVWGTSEDVAFRTIEAYLNVLQTQQIVQITRDYYRRVHKTYGLVEQRGESGIGRKADINQARSRLELARANLYAAKNNYRDAVTAYFKLTELYPTKLVMPPLPGYPAIPKTNKGVVITAIKNNPLLKSSVADVGVPQPHGGSKSRM